MRLDLFVNDLSADKLLLSRPLCCEKLRGHLPSLGTLEEHHNLHVCLAFYLARLAILNLSVKRKNLLCAVVGFHNCNKI